MSINAYEKIKRALEYTLEDIDSEYRVLSEAEIKERIRKGCGKGGYGTWFLENQKNPTTVSAMEYVFQNGLFFLDSEIHYTDDVGNSQTIQQFTLTPNYNHAPFVNIVLQRNLKSYRQLMTKTSPKDEIFTPEGSDVVIEKIKISVDRTCGDMFTAYKDLKTGILLKEEYQQGYPIVDQYVPSLKLLKLCGCFVRDLEVLYGNDSMTPIYAQLSDKYKVEDAGFDPNSKEDALKMVEMVSIEVDAIIERIQSLVDNYIIERGEFQKTIGTNPKAQ